MFLSFLSGFFVSAMLSICEFFVVAVVVGLDLVL